MDFDLLLQPIALDCEDQTQLQTLNARVQQILPLSKVVRDRDLLTDPRAVHAPDPPIMDGFSQEASLSDAALGGLATQFTVLPSSRLSSREELLLKLPLRGGEHQHWVRSKSKWERAVSNAEWVRLSDGLHPFSIGESRGRTRYGAC